jgi:hypothetical protein
MEFGFYGGFGLASFFRMINRFTMPLLRLAQWKCNLKVAQTKVSPDSSPKVTPDEQ